MWKKATEGEPKRLHDLHVYTFVQVRCSTGTERYWSKLGLQSQAGRNTQSLWQGLWRHLCSRLQTPKHWDDARDRY